jgi:hypothetical protein
MSKLGPSGMQGYVVLDFVIRMFDRVLITAGIRVSVAVDLNRRSFLESLDATLKFVVFDIPKRRKFSG